MTFASTALRSLLCTTALAGTLAAAEAPQEPGVMLREGTWDGGVGTFVVPQGLEGTQPEAWPQAGWSRITLKPDHVLVEPVVAPTSGKPAFLASILKSLAGEAPPEAAAAHEIPLYLRVPGAKLKSGAASAYRFQNGTTQLRPRLDHRYQLKLAAQTFAFTVQNGLRGKNGEPYGNGALYRIEYDGETYEYSIGEFGWDSMIQAIADVDGDGKPDFFIGVGGSNSGYEAVLLSSVAKPGRNAATASLKSLGC